MRGILALLFLCVTLNLVDGHHFSRENSLSHGVLGVKMMGIAAFILSGIGSTFTGSAALQHWTEDTGPNKPLHWMHRPNALGEYDKFSDGMNSPKIGDRVFFYNLLGYGSRSNSGGRSSHKKGHRSNHDSHESRPFKKGARENQDEGDGLSTTGYGSDLIFRIINLPRRGCRTNPNCISYMGRNIQRRGIGEGGNNGGSISSIRGSAYDVMYEANGTPKRGTGYNVSYGRNGFPKRGYRYDASYIGSPYYPKRGNGVKLGSGVDVYSNRGPGGKLSSGAKSFSESGPGGRAVSSASASSNVGPGGQTSSTASAFSDADSPQHGKVGIGATLQDFEPQNILHQMDNYKKGKQVEDVMEKERIPIPNLPEDFVWMQVSSGSKMKNLLEYAIEAMNEGKAVVWTGVGQSLGKAISCAEILKRKFSAHQISKICYNKIEDHWDPCHPQLEPLIVTRDIPTIHILISRQELDINEPGYQAPGKCDAFWKSNQQSSGKPRPDNNRQAKKRGNMLKKFTRQDDTSA